MIVLLEFEALILAEESEVWKEAVRKSLCTDDPVLSIADNTTAIQNSLDPPQHLDPAVCNTQGDCVGAAQRAASEATKGWALLDSNQ